MASLRNMDIEVRFSKISLTKLEDSGAAYGRASPAVAFLTHPTQISSPAIGNSSVNHCHRHFAVLLFT